jgi:hypothetical protein
MLVLHILNIHWRGPHHYSESVRTYLLDYHSPNYVEEPPPKIPEKNLSHVRYLVATRDDPPRSVPVTVCVFLFATALGLIVRSAARQKSKHWKNQMSRESILYAVEHLGVDLSQDVLFLT